MSSVDEVNSKLNMSMNEQFGAVSASKITNSINDKNRRDFKRHKLVSPLAFISRLHRSDKQLDIASP